MEPGLVVFLAVAAVLVVALAVYLTIVALRLRKVIGTLGAVSHGIETTVDRTQPIAGLVDRLTDAVGASTSGPQRERR